MTEVSDKFWTYVGNAGITSMICTFVSVISYLQEATFDSWGTLFATWAIGLIAGVVFFLGFNIKKIMTEGFSVGNAVAGFCGTLVPLLALVLGKVAYGVMVG